VHQNVNLGKSRITILPSLNFIQLVDIEQIQQLLEAQHKLTGILSAILDTEENVLAAVGWQDICVQFHRSHPVTCARCRDSDAYIKAHLRDFSEGYVDYRCKNGLRDVAMPIIVGGEHLATLFTGQFFYDDEKPDVEFFRAQAKEFCFDENAYIEALARVPICTREQIHNIMEYYRNLVRIMAELGLKNLNLAQEVRNRKRAEESMKEARDYLDNIINTIADPIIVRDREHRLVLVNDAACALAGRNREEMIGRTEYYFFLKSDVDVFYEQDKIVFETERENINEEEITDAQGQKRVFLAKKNLYRDLRGERYIVGIIRDITDLKQKEQMLVQQNRQAALGEMLDHIAHQWKQPLNSISLIIQGLELIAGDGELTNECIEETVSNIMALVDHMAQTLDVFRDFYSPEKEKTVFCIKDSIDSAIGFIAPALRLHDIGVELDVDAGVMALGYRREFAQVLLNLLGNARNALVERKIETPHLKLKAFSEGGKAVTTITDNAGGIPDPELDKIFEPYFTTRKAAGGTGLGLFMSKNIIEISMGGTLSAANVDGGAQFRIEIPTS
jgi:PAS domain S-box-containing protein